MISLILKLDSGSKQISTAQTRAPNKSLLRRLRLQNKSLLRRLGLQTNLFCADSGSKQISSAQTRAPNKSPTAQMRAPNKCLLRRHGLQTNLYCADSGSKTNLYCADWGSKQISTAQTRAPNKCLLRRLGLQTNLYCADTGSNKSLLRRLGLQTNVYCADLGSKQISTAQTRAPNGVIFSRWQRPYWDDLPSLFYSGRKRRRVVHLFYSLWFKTDIWSYAKAWREENKSNLILELAGVFTGNRHIKLTIMMLWKHSVQHSSNPF